MSMGMTATRRPVEGSIRTRLAGYSESAADRAPVRTHTVPSPTAKSTPPCRVYGEGPSSTTCGETDIALVVAGDRDGDGTAPARAVTLVPIGAGAGGADALDAPVVEAGRCADVDVDRASRDAIGPVGASTVVGSSTSVVLEPPVICSSELRWSPLRSTVARLTA